MEFASGGKMITDVMVKMFNGAIHAYPGDTIKVKHVVTDAEGKTVAYSKCEHEITEEVTWTHSILFKLNGKLNHLIGDHDTVSWIESLAK